MIPEQLIILGERWIPHHLAGFNWRDGKIPYILVYVIGTKSGDELFVMPVSDVDKEFEWLSPGEAEKLNNKK